MRESSVRRRLKRHRTVKVWFWDGEREYQGEAIALAPAGLTALLKMSQFSDATVIPTSRVIEGLRKHLSNRNVEFKISCQGLEATLKGKITLIQTDFENARRLLLEAEFKGLSERNLENVERLSRFSQGRAT